MLPIFTPSARKEKRMGRKSIKKDFKYDGKRCSSFGIAYEKKREGGVAVHRRCKLKKQRKVAVSTALSLNENKEKKASAFRRWYVVFLPVACFCFSFKKGKSFENKGKKIFF